MHKLATFLCAIVSGSIDRRCDYQNTFELEQDVSERRLQVCEASHRLG